MAAYQWVIVLCAVLQAAAARPTLQGTVEDSQGRLLAGARVDISTAAPRVGQGLFCPSCYLDCKKSARTDEQGKFSIVDLDPTLKFRVLVSMAGKQATLTSLVDPAATLVTIKLADQPTDIPPERVVQGIIVNRQGAPIEGAFVAPAGAKAGEKRWWGQVDGVDPTVSDHEGRFSMPLPETFLGVDLTVIADGYAGTQTEFLTPGANEHRIIIPLGTRVTGRLARLGTPLAGVRLAVVQTKRSMPHYFIKAVAATTDSEGRFAFDSLPADEDYAVFSLVAEGPQEFVITTKRFRASFDGQERNLGTLEAIPALRLAGRVQAADSQSLPSDAKIMLDRDPAWDLIAVPIQQDGSFEVDGLPPEAFGVRIGPKDLLIDTDKVPFQILSNQSFGLRLTKSVNDLSVPLKIPAENPSGVDRIKKAKDAELVHSAIDPVHGIVLSGRLLKDDQPRAGVQVKLSRTPEKTGNPSKSETITDADGRYRFSGLETGDKYFLGISDPDGLVVPGWLYQFPYAQTVPPMTSEIKLSDVHLLVSEQSLSGTVIDPQGKPVKGITVSAGMSDGRRLSRSDKGPVPWIETDKDGRFELRQLPNESIELMVYGPTPAGEFIKFATHVRPKLGQTDIRIVFDPTLTEEIENLDGKSSQLLRPINGRRAGEHK